MIYYCYFSPLPVSSDIWFLSKVSSHKWHSEVSSHKWHSAPLGGGTSHIRAEEQCNWHICGQYRSRVDFPFQTVTFVQEASMMWLEWKEFFFSFFKVMVFNFHHIWIILIITFSPHTDDNSSWLYFRLLFYVMCWLQQNSANRTIIMYLSFQFRPVYTMCSLVKKCVLKLWDMVCYTVHCVKICLFHIIKVLW